jgi:hypothetical protein
MLEWIGVRHQVFAILRVEKDGMKISAGVRSLARST